MKVHSDREPIPTRLIPRIHVTSPVDPDATTTAAVPSQETAREITAANSAAGRARVRLPERARVRLPERARVRLLGRARVRLPERARVRLPERARVRLLGRARVRLPERARVRLPEAEAEGAPPVQRTRTTSSAPITTVETTSQTTTTSSARALVERIGNEAGEDSQPTQIRRIAALMTECEELSISDDIAEARRIHLEKLTKVKDAIIKVAQRTNVTTKPLIDQWVDHIYDDGARKARWTTRGHEQTPKGSEDFFSATPAMMHLKMMLVDAALKGHVAAIGDYSGAFCQSPLNPYGTESKV